MAEEITLPQGQEIVSGSFQGKNGRVGTLMFAATYNGKLLGSCQALGDDARKAELVKAMEAGTPVPLGAAPVHNEKFNRWDIRFAGGSGYGGGGKQWTPAGYRGQALTPDTFWKGMTDALIQSKTALATAGIADPNGDHAQDLASQFFILVERNVITLAVASTQLATSAVRTDGVGQGEQEYIEQIEMCGAVEDVDAVMAVIRREVSDKVLQAKLLGAALKAKRNLTTQGGAI